MLYLKKKKNNLQAQGKIHAPQNTSEQQNPVTLLHKDLKMELLQDIEQYPHGFLYLLSTDSVEYRRSLCTHTGMGKAWKS